MKRFFPVNKRLSLLLASLLLVLGGCGVSTINVSGNYPSPLVSKLPVTLGVYYTDEFRNFQFTEVNDNTGKDEIIVKSGPSQVQLFNTVLPSVFSKVVVIDDISSIDSYPGLDLVFVPVIEEFQLGLPNKTKLDVYEVWIKYNMRLSTATGDNIADWVMTAYGKSPEESFQSIDSGVNNAAVVALRDLAASFTLGFADIPEVNEWLGKKSLEK
ncbi:MAG: hypothetical protein RQ899_11110 [Pseudomonadales bacterium]|nr:hypothetical protein [Pseudomonadales bacterium]